MAELNLAIDYVNWLKDRITVIKQGKETVLSTPFLDPFHDGIRVYVEHNRQGELILHDNGNTIDNLSCQGIKIDKSERRKKIIERAIAGCAVRINNERLETTATLANLPQRVHFLLTAVLRLNDLWMSSVPHAFTDFFEMVQEFFDQKEILYTPNVSIPGHTVEHPIDFVIPLPKKRERLIKLMGSPQVQTAKVISFTWFDLRDVRPNAEKIVILNDLRSRDAFGQESEEEFKRISEQTTAILSGYSTDIYRWSERNSDRFAHLWKNN